MSFNVTELNKTIESLPQYTVGASAFYDAFTHILPCKVIEVIEEGNGFMVTKGKLVIRCNAKVGPYEKGETLTVTAYHTYPKECRIQRDHSTRISPFYRWVKPSE